MAWGRGRCSSGDARGGVRAARREGVGFPWTSPGPDPPLPGPHGCSGLGAESRLLESPWQGNGAPFCLKSCRESQLFLSP